MYDDEWDNPRFSGLKAGQRFVDLPEDSKARSDEMLRRLREKDADKRPFKKVKLTLNPKNFMRKPEFDADQIVDQDFVYSWPNADFLYHQKQLETATRAYNWIVAASAEFAAKEWKWVGQWIQNISMIEIMCTGKSSPISDGFIPLDYVCPNYGEVVNRTGEALARDLEALYEERQAAADTPLRFYTRSENA